MEDKGGGLGRWPGGVGGGDGLNDEMRLGGGEGEGEHVG